jgi:hypothetical protein
VAIVVKSLKELQEVAESKGREHFMDERMVCLYSTLYAVKDAMSEVDDIDYTDPHLIKATNGLVGGFWAGTGPCGIVTAGAIAISLKYGTGEATETRKVFETGMRARDWYLWFKRVFGSCNCIDLAVGTDWTDEEDRTEYNEGPRRYVCNVYLTQALRKIIDYLSLEDENVSR